MLHSLRVRKIDLVLFYTSPTGACDHPLHGGKLNRGTADRKSI
jgi:hypothetical protein